ncbi:MAG: HEPN domain-containing protein [Planctomycetota bacterium]
MADWRDIARDNLKAAQALSKTPHLRSCASRAYYAAFSAVTFALSSHARSGRGHETPAHQAVPGLLEKHLEAKLGARRLTNVKKMMRRLYNERLSADYRSGLTLDDRSIRQSLRDAFSVCVELGIEPGGQHAGRG